MKPISRRGFLQMSALGAGTLMLPRWGWSVLPKQAEPHFFIQIFLQGGADASYMFDARPLAMTAAGLIQNYNGVDPAVDSGVNGTKCLMAPPMKPLLPYRDRFTVLNGVHMLSSFPGHPENISYYFTGSGFGGESFLPHLNEPTAARAPAILDTIQNGQIFLSTTNSGSTVQLNPSSVGPLVTSLTYLPKLSGDPELEAHMRSRLAANSTGAGRFSNGTKEMSKALDQVDRLHGQLLHLPPAREGVDDDTRFVEFIGEAFRSQISRSALWTLDAFFDVHDETSAKNQPTVFLQQAERLARIFKALKDTPFDAQNSVLDVTTVVVSTDFGRTMRQLNAKFAVTGTDHNQFTNSMLIAGKGIKGGQVIGESDFATAGEVLSGAHLQKDPDKISIFGRPFDFTTMRPRSDKPAAYADADYLNCASVVNTIYSLFNVPAARYRTLIRNGPAAPLLSGLLA